jgi:hypothetical protein
LSIFTLWYDWIQNGIFDLPQLPWIMLGMMFFSGMQLFAMGLLGEYITAIHFQVRRRPLVVERERINFDPARSDPSSISTPHPAR